MRLLAILWAFLAGNLLHRGGASYAGFAGPYALKIKAMGNCPKTEVSDQLSPLDLEIRTVVRHNHTSRIEVMDTNLTISNDVYKRGETQVKLDVARWDTVSGWREHFLVMPLGEICFVLNEIMFDIVKFFPLPTKCPITDGKYSRGNVPSKVNPMRHFPSLPYGRYRTLAMFMFLRKTKGPQVRGCMRIIVDVVPSNEA